MTGRPVGTSSSNSDASKLLSVTIMGRDDDYMPDFHYRITTSVDYLARNLEQLGRLDDVEILVTDWGSHVPLSQSLSLSPAACRICRFVYVAPALVRAVQDGGDGFHTTMAMNTALRRACGRFLMVFPADQLMPQHSIEVILKLVDGSLRVPVGANHALFLLARYHVPWQYVVRQPSLAEWDRYLFLNAGKAERDVDSLAAGGGAGALLMHRSMWHEFRGFDEKLGMYGYNDVEFGVRANEQHTWVDPSVLGVSVFHMQHIPGSRRDRVVTEGANPPLYNLACQVNDEDWGLAQHDLEVQTAQNVREPETVTSTEPSSPLNIESWDQSRREIKAELASSRIREHLEQVLEFFLLGSRGEWHVDPADIDAMFLLSWYSLFHHPRNYLEFGAKQGCAIATVGACVPSVEIYGIDTWEGVLQAHSPLEIARMLHHAYGHRGFARFVNGDIDTALARLRASFLEPFTFDLVLVRADMLQEGPFEQVGELLDSLASGGALVLTCRSPGGFEALWPLVQRKFPRFSYFRCMGSETGMVLAASLRGDDNDGALEECFYDRCHIEDLVMRWDSSQRLPLLRRLYCAISQPTGYPQYVARACGWVRRMLLGRTGR